MDERFNFGEVIEGLKQGKRFERHGWNGKGMYLRLVNPHNDHMFSVNDNHAEADGTPQPFIAMKTADGALVPWLASQTDMLAEDWRLVR